MKVIWLIILISWAVSVVATPTKQVELFFDAYNKYNIEKMLEKKSEEVKSLHNINDRLLLEKDGKDALRKTMVTHFNRQNNSRSQMKRGLTLGDKLAVTKKHSRMMGNALNVHCLSIK
jgi:hypothetical protein